MNNGFRHDPQAFETTPAASEVLPLLMVRRALARWSESLERCREASARSLASPDDDRLARCVRQLEAEAETFRNLAARAVQAWAGHRSGIVFIHDIEGDPALVRVEFAKVPMISIVRPGEADMPGESEVFDLVEAERSLVRRAVESVETDPERKTRCFAQIDGGFHVDRIGDYLGRGSTPGRIAWMLVETEIARDESTHTVRVGASPAV